MTGKHSKKIKISTVCCNIFTIVIVLLFLLPLYVALVTSFKTPMEIADSVLALPRQFSFSNYINGMEESQFARSLINSVIVTFPAVLMIVIFSAMGGYAIARFSNRNRMIRFMDKLYLSSLMIPFQVIMIPVYKTFKDLGLLNSLGGMILMLTGYSIAYPTFLIVGFVKSIPRVMEEAATIDGCGPFKCFFVIVLPLLKPIVATVAALHVMWLWNDYNIAVILLQKDEVRTLTVKQYYFFSEFSSDYGMSFAAAIICMLPILIFFVLMQKNLVEGISAGAVKS